MCACRRPPKITGRRGRAGLAEMRPGRWPTGKRFVVARTVRPKARAGISLTVAVADAQDVASRLIALRVGIVEVANRSGRGRLRGVMSPRLSSRVLRLRAVPYVSLRLGS